jgi:hypothetical protein
MMQARPHTLELEEELVLVAPEPVLARLKRADDRVVGLMKVPGRVLAGRVVTAADMPARLAHPQVNPYPTCLQALFAAGTTRRDVADLIEVRALAHGVHAPDATHVHDELRAPTIMLTRWWLTVR